MMSCPKAGGTPALPRTTTLSSAQRHGASFLPISKPFPPSSRERTRQTSPHAAWEHVPPPITPDPECPAAAQSEQSTALPDPDLLPLPQHAIQRLFPAGNPSNILAL